VSAAPASGLEAVTSDEAVRQGIVATCLGMAAMIARLLMSTEKESIGFIIRSSITAGLTAYFVNFVAKDYGLGEGLRVGVCGVAGFASPEILNSGLAFIKAKMAAKVKEAEAKVKGGKLSRPKKGSKRGK